MGGQQQQHEPPSTVIAGEEEKGRGKGPALPAARAATPSMVDVDLQGRMQQPAAGLS